jgi:hypothetical protein
VVCDSGAAGPADHVPDEKNAQSHQLRKSNIPVSVST